MADIGKRGFKKSGEAKSDKKHNEYKTSAKVDNHSLRTGKINEYKQKKETSFYFDNARHVGFSRAFDL
jgi:hypothetical protein